MSLGDCHGLHDMKATDLAPHFTHFLSLKVIDIYTFYPASFISTDQKQNLLITFFFMHAGQDTETVSVYLRHAK